MKYALSKLIPVRMTSKYMICDHTPERQPTFPERSTWWQWRGRIWAHHRYPDFERCRR